MGHCTQCGDEDLVCDFCHRCDNHCRCGGLFDADELGLDPETDNTPGTETRHA